MTIYTCSNCQYESPRRFNVIRHRERIHVKKRVHNCCGIIFYTKGDYYLHCEQRHPETRSNAVLSKTKYKITSNSDTLNNEKHIQRLYRSSDGTCSYKWELKKRYSQRIRMKQDRQEASEMSVKYSVTYSDFEIEDIPLISFLTDRQLKSHLKSVSSQKLKNKTHEKSAEKANETMKIAIKSGENIEKVVLQNDEENIHAKVLSDSTVSSISVELPTKKLILKRFRTSIRHEFEIPLRERNNNICGQVNFTTESKESRPVHQSLLKNSKWRANKENVSAFAFSLEQELNVKLDTGITVPVVTQRHREFLAAIDFDAYRIF
ncbi:PREDICTED: uncharacterized protein LOC107188912 [Dufourea novaeangliae]|uniref:C2H2-type domain-containing protein n=1 Tax=Dufourea novaeangliae TaxID=178035 RepID=A0A154PHZ7_DUFNO|nr:PREDICTED: uncharacterized protein LOC107188912 [Dufourea novaeangliae]KZC10820.1 hypothetical protein WN55_01519 [Dufourea novaeangliae]